MDTKERLQQCFEKLGFSSTFPSTLHINPSTNFIWQQIINNVKPKKEVEMYKKNIIINRIENKLPLNASQCPVPEIEIYNRLNTVKEDIAKIKARILEKQNKQSSLQSNNRANYVIINSMKERNEEQRIKLYAIKLKCNHYKNEVKEIKEILSKREISSVPMELSVSSDSISEQLHHLLVETEKCSINYRYADMKQLECTLSQTSMPSIKRLSKVCFSTVKKSQRRVNDLQRFVSCNNLPTARALFTEASKENNTNRINCDDLHLLDNSGDLLPESCFNFEADDQFLLSSQPSYKQTTIKSNSNITSSKGDIFGTDTNICGQSYLEKRKQKRDYFTQAFSNRHINENIENIFKNSNREIIWHSLCSLLRSVKLELEQSMGKTSFRNREICSDDLLPLNFIFIKNNLLCLKSKKQIKELKTAIREKKSEIEKKLCKLEEGNIKSLEFQMDAIKLEGAIHFLHKEVYNNNTSDHQTTLKTLKTRMNKIKNELQMKVEEIEDYIEIKEDLMQRIKKCQEDTFVCVRKLNKFLFNPSWADGLSENINSNEIEVFHDYPMDFIKRFYFVDRDTFYRDSMKDFSMDQLTPNDILYELTSLLQHPHKPPEKIFAVILQKIYKLQVLSSLEYPEVILPEKQYSFLEFQGKEIYMDTFCEKINAFIHSNKVHHILRSSSYLRSNMDLWLDMPFRRFISQDRIVDDKTYNEYEEAFNYLKNNK
ncbi:uncharacterized protein LOC123308450 [Coccinella septempunctata]|uniref:uncharacterized protein LOC123308450 n=1 Tax=Coccinella septempunctata TaxID=41139 RepID=UPI001D07B33B|nr:uncharacterized protein LOC123308450 [Coccinella septempunctata]XP_044747034.1 uncharacterized protein LOC123308450 [Coccinella septempunctata]